MNSTNPFTPPRAAVADISDTYGGEFQPMKVWGWRGRIGRLRFLGYGTVAYLFYMLAVMAVTAMSMRGERSTEAGDGSSAIGLAIWLLLVPYLVFVALVTIRRSHDMGWSGWMSLLAFIPLVGLIWIFKAGNLGANAYGSPPPPNTFGVKLAAFGLLGVFFIGGILAAIAVPAYHDYVKRAQAAQIGK